MKTYITVIPEKDDDREADAVLNFSRQLMRDGIKTRFVLTNMERERPGFRKASELTD